MRVFRFMGRPADAGLRKALDALDAVAVRRDLAGSIEEFALAEHLAKGAFEKKTNIARSLRYEFLLWISGKTDIKSAMASTSPGDSDGFFVVVFSDAGSDAVCRMLDSKKLPLGLEKKAAPLALERISLSRIIG